MNRSLRSSLYKAARLFWQDFWAGLKDGFSLICDPPVLLLLAAILALLFL